MARRFLLAQVSGISGVALVAACSSSGGEAPAPPPEEPAGVYVPPAATETPPQDEPLDPNYPTAHTAMPTLDYHGGRVIKAIQIVTVTFPGDGLKDRLENFGDTITQTPWWDAVSEGYCDKQNNCVGRGTSGGHVVMPAAADASYVDSSRGETSSIQEMIKARVADGTFPVPTSETLFAIYFPATTKIVLDGDASCRSFGAYHNTVKVVPPGAASDATPISVPYAIMPRCQGGERSLTISASHEFTEAATDPDVGLNGLAYYMMDPLWASAGGENADLCVGFGAGDDSWQESGYVVQRVWSNKSAAAGHNPCVPLLPSSVYFNAAPAAGKENIALKVGESATIEVTAFSDGPMADWELNAVDFASFYGDAPSLDFQWSKTTVHNGSKPKLKITLQSSPRDGSASYAIVSKNARRETHYWPAVVFEK